MTKTYYIGLDVHKETIAIAYAAGGAREDSVYHGPCGGSVLAAERALRKLAEKLGVEFSDLKVCYEAGPTGFVLARRLIRYGLDCVLMSPSKTERKPNEKIKTDKRDACKIARIFRNGDITQVRIPPVLDEAVRDVCRARTDASDDLSRAKQRHTTPSCCATVSTTPAKANGPPPTCATCANSSCRTTPTRPSSRNTCKPSTPASNASRGSSTA
jgi:hypothetical protein